MPHAVLLTEDAERDLEAIHAYIVDAGSPLEAERLLDRLLKVVESLAESPERGSHPRELLALGIREYRQTMFKPWRVIYRIFDRRIVIYLIADSRRDMQTLLAQRLLGA